MSEAEKTEWPTEKKLDLLRSYGVVPFSPSAVNLIRSATVSIALGIVAKSLLKIRSELSTAEFSLRGMATVLADHIFTLLLLPAILVVFTAVLGALLQTLFLFPVHRLHLKQPSFSLRLFSLPAALRALTLQLLGVVLGVLSLWYVFPSATSILVVSSDAPYASFNTGKAAAMMAVLSASMLLLAGIFVGLSHLIFRFKHRMTRHEMEHESDESSISKIL